MLSILCLLFTVEAFGAFEGEGGVTRASGVDLHLWFTTVLITSFIDRPMLEDAC